MNSKEYLKMYYAKNKEQIQAYQKEYQKKYRETHKEQAKKYRKEHQNEYKNKYKNLCNRDCFNCIYHDCILPDWAAVINYEA